MGIKVLKNTKKVAVAPGDDSDMEVLAGDRVGAAARLIIQGKHRFYTLTMYSDILATTSTVDTRAENSMDGFQRKLDAKRADEIADYIDNGFGTIPCSIVLSAQPEAELTYTSKSQTLRFKKSPRSFLILDGQHRVFGFARANSRLRVPVVIYNNLSRMEEARLFIDINTNQRPVPNELLLDIKRLAGTERGDDALLTDVFDLFAKELDSSLLGLTSSASSERGKISRVTFYAAVRSILGVFGDSQEATDIYQTLNAYLHNWLSVLRAHNASQNIANKTLFRAVVLLFPAVAERVSDRYNGQLTKENFYEVLKPFFSRLKPPSLKSPGASPTALHEIFKRALQSGFSIGQRVT
jgi:DGQHR domain-containing protein